MKPDTTKVRGLTIGRQIELPRPINFIRIRFSEDAIPVKDLTDDELKEFGDACTAQLIDHARSRR